MNAKGLRVVRATKFIPVTFVLVLAVGLLLGVSPGYALYTITDSDFLTSGDNEIGSGNGKLDFIFFLDAAGGGISENSGFGFDGDDANTEMPKGGPNTTAQESFVTSIGELREFYELNFPDGQGGSTIVEIALFVDLNQTGSNPDLTLNNLIVVADYLDLSGDPFGDDRDDPWTFDVSSDLQNITETDFSGTVLSELDAPKTLALNEQGAGFGDYAIKLGIDPFDPAFSPSTRLLFFWDSADHNDGGETIFLSGTYGIIPEPATVTLVGLGTLLLFVRRKRR